MMSVGLVFSVEVLSPDGKASRVLPLELDTQDQAEGVAAMLESLGTRANIVQRTRWAPMPDIQVNVSP